MGSLEEREREREREYVQNLPTLSAFACVLAGLLAAAVSIEGGWGRKIITLIIIAPAK